MLQAVCAVVHGYSWPRAAASWHLPNVTASPTACCDACRARDGCVTWTVHPEKDTGCWLHGEPDQPPSAVPCADFGKCISGNNGSDAPLPPVHPQPAPAAAGCSSDADCSLNGICELQHTDHSRGRCRCDSGWTGSTCAVLDLLPVPPATGGKIWPQDNATSSWGANVVWRGGRWEMVVSEMGGHCGLASWQHNSFLRRATSTQLQRNYSKKEVVMPYFSHNAMPTQMSDGALVVWHVGLGTPRAVYITGCTNGTTPSAAPSPTPPAPVPKLPSWFPLPYTEQTGDGTWTWQTTNVTTLNPPNDEFHIGNLASHEFSNGTVLLSYTVRSFSYPPNATILARGFGLAVAETWRGPFRPLFGSWGQPAVETRGEDSFLWQDARGNFHMIFHVALNTGGHAYSSDGWSWTLSKDSEGATIESYSSSVADTGGHQQYYGVLPLTSSGTPQRVAETE